MKKLSIIIALVLWVGGAQVAEAQNMYRNYSSTTIPSPESAVSLVHSNGHLYYFQTGKAISSPWGLSIAEVDPYSLTLGLNVGQLGGAFSGATPCQSLQYPYVDIYYNSLEMKNLAYNYYNPCLPVLIAGVNGSGCVLTETYDILASSCDRPLDVNVVQASPIPQPYTINNGSMDKNFNPFPITFSTDFLSMQYLCDEPSACSHQFGGKSIRNTLLNKESVREIIIEGDNQFICEGFDGNIQYSLNDMAGKLLQKGTIRNGERNHLNVSEGVYLIRAFDTSHSLVVKKVVIF